MRPIAIFDIDGTIFRSSLTIELFKLLVKRRIFEPAFMKKVRRLELKWLDRQGHYDDYIMEVVRAYQRALAGKKQKDIVRISHEVIAEQKYRTYRYTRALLINLRRKHFLIGISGSPLEVVKEYNKFLKFDKIYGSEFGIDEKGRYTGQILHEPPRYKKELIMRYATTHGVDFRGSIGIGDTESDLGFLELVEKPICFNPNTNLAREARKRNWPIVIERKDLVVEFKPERVKFLKI